MRTLLVTAKNRKYEITRSEAGTIVVDGRTVRVDLVELGGGHFSIRVDGRHYAGFVRSGSNDAAAAPESDRHTFVTISDREYELIVDDETSLLKKSLQGARESATGTIVVKAPMPGLVVKVDVSIGNHMKAGQPLLVLEAMKMENEIRTTEGGLVQTVHVKAGTAVEKGEPLVTLSRE